MIVRTIQEDIFKSDVKHIAFAVNVEGFNDSGFAGQVSSQYWKELADIPELKIGTVISKTVGDKIFHALVCHSLHQGWGENQEEIIKHCFDLIPSNDEPVATIAIGTGLVGKMSGADFGKIVCGMHDSKQQIILHAGCTLEEVIQIYNKEKEKQSLTNEKNLALKLSRTIKGLLKK